MAFMGILEGDTTRSIALSSPPGLPEAPSLMTGTTHYLLSSIMLHSERLPSITCYLGNEQTIIFGKEFHHGFMEDNLIYDHTELRPGQLLHISNSIPFIKSKDNPFPA